MNSMPQLASSLPVGGNVNPILLSSKLVQAFLLLGNIATGSFCQF